MATLRAFPSGKPIGSASAERVDMKFEAVVTPVANVDRSKEFYTKLGWRLDADFPFDNGFRVVQFAPLGSGCSVQFGTKITSAPPGLARGLYLIVSDVAAARKDLVVRDIEVSEVFHPERQALSSKPTAAVALTVPHPSMPPTTRSPPFVIPTAMDGRFRKTRPGCLAEDSGNLNVAMLTELLQEAEKHHGEYEAGAPKHHRSGCRTSTGCRKPRSPTGSCSIR